MYLVGEAHHLALASWRVMFLISGGVTLLIGVLFIFVMPLDTTVAWFLSPDERRIATERLALDRGTRDRSEFNYSQVQEALGDVTTWLLFLMALFICIPSPILKVDLLNPNICAADLTNGKPVLVSRHQRVRIQQVQNYACWPPFGGHADYRRLGLCPGNEVDPQSALLLGFFHDDCSTYW